MRWIVLFILVAALAGVALAVERFPLPDFPQWYNQPELSQPSARSVWLEYADLAVLLAALAAAAYLGLRARSRCGLVVLTLLALGYFGFYRRGCICPIGAIQNVAVGLLAGQAVPLFVLGFFLLPLAAAILFGRTFCAGVCPLGAIQDLVLLKPLRLPAWLEHGLGLLPWVYLAAAVLLAVTGSSFIICRYDPFVGIFRLNAPANMLIFGACVLGIAVFVGRPYCRFACPYGALMRPLASISWRHVTITPEECVNCRLCEDACPFNAIQKPTPKDPEVPRTQGGRLLAALIVLLPVLVVAGGLAGWLARRPLAWVNAKVRLADHVRVLEPMDRAAKLATRPPLTVGGRTYDVVRGQGPARIVATDAVSGAGLWDRPVVFASGGDEQMSYSRYALFKVACDGNAVWVLVEDKQIVDSEPIDVYGLVVLDAGSGRQLRRSVYRLDANLTKAFRDSGATAWQVYQEADGVLRQFAVGSWLAGGFVGLVVGLKLLQLSVRRTRVEHYIDRARCVSCGRCFKHCPVEHRRLKRLREGKADE